MDEATNLVINGCKEAIASFNTENQSIELAKEKLAKQLANHLSYYLLFTLHEWPKVLEKHYKSIKTLEKKKHPLELTRLFHFPELMSKSLSNVLKLYQYYSRAMTQITLLLADVFEEKSRGGMPHAGEVFDNSFAKALCMLSLDPDEDLCVFPIPFDDKFSNNLFSEVLREYLQELPSPKRQRVESDVIVASSND